MCFLFQYQKEALSKFFPLFYLCLLLECGGNNSIILQNFSVLMLYNTIFKNLGQSISIR